MPVSASAASRLCVARTLLSTVYRLARAELIEYGWDTGSVVAELPVDRPIARRDHRSMTAAR